MISFRDLFGVTYSRLVYVCTVSVARQEPSSIQQYLYTVDNQVNTYIVRLNRGQKAIEYATPVISVAGCILWLQLILYGSVLLFLFNPHTRLC